MKFRYDINFLRAIAVTGVLLYHFKVRFFSGGFSGVDVFFVISGYLMSGIILRGLNSNSFSILDFYGKRVKRIIPALLVLITVVTVACFFFYFPSHYKQNEKNGMASILFLSNIFYWQNSSYFDPSSNSNIFLHTWSLSVEWQFYLLYPFILIGLSKAIKNKSRFLLSFVVLTAIICVASIIYTGIDPTASFYLLPTRSWEMLFGGIAFLGEGFITEKRKQQIIALVGYSLIFLSFVFLRTKMSWPGPYTLIPVIATFMVIVAGYNDFKVLKMQLVQLAGKISYSTYLWHWPVFVVFIYIGSQRSTSVIALLILISFVLGYCSFRFVESIKYTNSKIILSLAAILAVVTLSLSYFDSNRVIFKPLSVQLAGYKQSLQVMISQFNTGNCFISSEYKVADFKKMECLTFKQNEENFLFLGDSHAAALSGSLRELLSAKNINLMQANASGCLPLLKAHKTGEKRCSEIMDFIYDDFVLNNRGKIDGVIITAHWINATSNSELLEDMKRTISFFNEQKIKVIIIGQNETYRVPYPFILAKENEYDINIRQKYLDERSYELNSFLKAQLPNSYIDIFNPANLVPGLSPNNDPYMFDANHFTRYGADLTMKKIMSSPIALNFLAPH